MDNKTFLGKRRDRAIATILGFKEREVDSFLPEDISFALRKTILDQVNEICDLAFDLMASDSVIFNEEFVNKIDEIHFYVKNELT